MVYTSLQDIFLSVTLAVYMACCVTCSAIKFYFRFKPFNKYMDYYYPSRKTIVYCFLTGLLMFPAAFMPGEADALIQLRQQLMLTSPFFCAFIMCRFYGSMLDYHVWIKPLWFMSIPYAVLTAISIVFCFIPGTQIEGPAYRWLFGVTGLVAVTYMGCFMFALIIRRRALKRFSEENYSNLEDFPEKYATDVIWFPYLHVAISWLAAFLGSPAALSLCMLSLSVVNVAFLISTLTPHRSLSVSDLEAREKFVRPQTRKRSDETLSPDRKDEILRIIRLRVEDEKAYLDCHLTLSSLSRACGVNRSYLSQVMSERLGGFFVYVNRCRLDHASALKAENPASSVEEVAVASGFGSRQSYYNVRRQLN